MLLCPSIYTCMSIYTRGCAHVRFVGMQTGECVYMHVQERVHKCERSYVRVCAPTHNYALHCAHISQAPRNQYFFDPNIFH